jgi:hypothetical protein
LMITAFVGATSLAIITHNGVGGGLCGRWRHEPANL